MGKMLLMDSMEIWLVPLLMFTRVAAMSFNQPKFCPSTTWNATGITFADGSIVGQYPYAIHVNTHNTVYVTNRDYGWVQIWREGNITPAITFSVSPSPLWSLLVTITDNIYVDNNDTGIDQWALNSSSKISTLYAGGDCFDLFLDRNDSLYCVLNLFHKVIRRSLASTDDRMDVVAGTGCRGIAQDMLNNPWGTFVDTNYNLYVADSGNNRIQLFYSGQSNGITVAGRAAPGTIILNFPTDIVLDGNGYLFIVDSDNHRIIRSGPTGFLCIAGCSGSSGSRLDQLYYPGVMAFDNYGNIFVTDHWNNRTQKFLLATNVCDTTAVSQQSWTSATNKISATTNAPSAAHEQTISYNRPKFCGVPSWNSNGTTFDDQTTIGTYPYSLFINTNNTLYAIVNSLNRVQVWFEGNISPMSIASARFNRSFSLFVTNLGDMFVDNGYYYGEVDQWSINVTNSTLVMFLTKPCYGLFIDTNNTLYCSLQSLHQVVSRSLNNALTALKGVAGTGCGGSAADMLWFPMGIFIDINFDLYVADYYNDRVQRFPPGQSNAITVAGNGLLGTIILYHPTSVVLDADGYLFIVDSGKHRIVGLGSSGFRCLVGCSGTSGSNSNQLYFPSTMAFDSYGNIFVTDTGNSRIQKFSLETNLCDPMTTSAIQTTDSERSTQVSEEQSTSISASSEKLSSAINAITIASTSATPSNQTCFSPIITLMCNVSSLASPLEFERSEDFLISSELQVNCDQSLSTISQWEIYDCIVNCASPVQIDQAIVTTSNELFIPAKTLPYGTYQLKLTVSMMIAPHLTSSTSVYVKIMSSSIIPNLVQYGTSMITHGYQQDLVLDPGTFSVDPDNEIFNTENWNYDYYCRIYGRYDFPSLGSSYLTIDDPTIDPLNPSCLSNRSANGTALQYGGTSSAIKSSLTVLANSLIPNHTYQFMVRMKNRQNPSMQAVGFLLVQVVDTPSQLVLVACVIATLCTPNREYQYVNPKTQMALFSVCTGSCFSVINITWNIYYGMMNSTSNMVQWTPSNQTNEYQNRWFFGLNTANLTSESSLFATNSSIRYWRFEVVYSFPTEITSSALHFITSQSPQNGSCSISPQNGTTSTLFTVSCTRWQDEHGIQDYSIYSWTTDRTDRTMVVFSPNPTVQLRLPAGTDNRSLVNAIVYIRNKLGCVTEFNLSSVIVISDSARIMNLVKILQTPNNQINKHPLARILANGNQNNIGQIITSLSQRFNQINQQTIHDALANGIPAADISVSTLNSQTPSLTTRTINSSALIEYNQRLNTYARVRDYLITYTMNLLIASPNSVILQAFSLAQLTQATNQLTRTTSMLASMKCYQLAVALRSVAKKISVENVQTAATQIAQCANNALNAINGPLQKRTTTLDLDSSRANTLPEDYDTDLELEWSNIKLFLDENDFSSENIEKSRNIYYQRQVANKISVQTTETIELLTAALHVHLNINQSLLINTSSTFMSLETTSIESLSKKSIKQSGDARIQLPTNFQLNTTNHTAITVRSTVRSLASFGDARTQPTTNLSRSISLTLVDQYGKEILIRANTSDPIKLLIPRDPNMVIPPMTPQNVTATTIPNHLLFNLHFVDIRSALPVSIHFEIGPQNINLGYLLIYRFDRSPVFNNVAKEIDGWTLLCPSNLNSDRIYTYFIDNQKTTGHQSVIFGIRELDSIEMNDACSNSSMINPPITNQYVNFTADYDLRVYTSGCYYLDANNNWQADGLVVGPSTNHHETECYSTHLTAFAGGFLVLPAPINWSYVFANADFNKNMTVYITLICVCILYLLLVIYARYKDKKDVEKLGVTPLPDNHRPDQYFYQILVFTGHRKNAGTKSKVHLVISGDDNETQVRTLADPRRPVLQRGGIDAFIMTVPKSLGSLNYIHIWHDNTGQGASASWFLKYIIVRDLQTMEKTYFICQKWFAVEKGDGMIERVLPAAGEYQKREFSYVLSKQAYHSISEGHLWFSIFSRPPSNKFTRVQRCTCCFVLLLTAMLLNILYYDQAADAKNNNNKTSGSLALGPLYITPEQISIGVVVEILSFLPSILLVQFFRRIQPRHIQQKLSPLRQAIYQMKQQPLPEMTPTAAKKKKEFSLTFPWWCLFIAYGISLIFAAISMFFIIARGIEFGDLKTQKWLTSLLSGFFSSILLIQPLKVLILAIVFAFFCRNTDKDREAEEFIGEDHPALEDDEEYLHSKERESPFTNRSRRPINRLEPAEVVWARDQRIQEIEMWNILREIFHYATFLALLYFVSYSNINQQAFSQVQHLQHMFLNTRQPNHDYTKISTIDEYWSWLNSSFIPNLRAQKWYNDELPKNLSGYIADRSNRLIGWPVMRQVRVQPDACRIENSFQQYFNHCDADYSFSNQEKQSFTLEWINQTTEISNHSIDQAFAYQDDDALDSYINIGRYNTYDSGGYVYQFRGRLSSLYGNISELRRLQWIDSRTRAVIIQFTLYNPNSELFSAVTLLTEFLPTGGVETNARFEPVTFQIFRSIPQLICFIIYMIFIIYMMVLEIQSLIKLKWKYFKQFWSLINVGIVICSWTTVGIYIWRYQEANRIGDLFASTNGYVYINLQLAVYVSDLYIYLLGFCCFFGTIQFLHLFRFNHRILFFMRTLQHASGALLGFAMMFSIVFMAFVALFHLLFVSKLWSCSNLFLTAGMLMEMMLMKFNTTELSAAAAFLGPLCFTLFIFIVVFVCLSMFLTIINESFRSVRDEAKIHSAKDPQILAFMVYKLQRWIGLGKTDELQQFIEKDEQMRSKYLDPIEQFPEKMDQLLEALNRIYMDQQVHKKKK